MFVEKTVSLLVSYPHMQVEDSCVTFKKSQRGKCTTDSEIFTPPALRLQVYLNPNKPRPVTCRFSHAFLPQFVNQICNAEGTNFPTPLRLCLRNALGLARLVTSGRPAQLLRVEVLRNNSHRHGFPTPYHPQLI